MKKLLLLIPFILVLAGCSASDPIKENVYFNGIYLNGGQLTSPAYGQIYTENVPTNLTVAVANTFYPYTFDKVGLHLNTTLSTGSIKIGSTGTYWVTESASSKSNSGAAREVHWHVFLNGVTSEEIAGAFIQNQNDQATVASSGILHLSAGDVLTLEVTSTTPGDVITTDHASLAVNRIGP